MDAAAETTVEFRLHGQSGDALLRTDTVTLDDDGAYGGDLDGSRSYDLNDAVAAAGDPDATSHQVKITTHTTYSRGADTKYRVVSVSGCQDSGGVPARRADADRRWRRRPFRSAPSLTDTQTG